MIAKWAILDIASGCRDALPLDMVMVAFLRETNLVLEAQHLRPVFAERAVHIVVTTENFAHPVGECGDDLGMIIQISRFHEFGCGMRRSNLVGKAVDPIDQNPRKQEIGEHDHALEAKLHDMFKTWLDKREGHTGIADLGPAETHPFPQHAGNLGNVRIGIGVGGAAPDHDKTGIGPINRAMFGIGGRNGLGNAVSGRLQHLQIDRQLAPILDGDTMLGGIGVQDRRDIILRMTGGKQHARHGKNVIDALLAKLVEPGLDHRGGEFEISILNRPVGKQRCEFFRQDSEFSYRRFRARAVTADHHSEFPWGCIMHRLSSPLAGHPRQGPGHRPLRYCQPRYCQPRYCQPRHGPSPPARPP